MKALFPPGPRDWCFGLTLGLRSLREPLTFLQDVARRYGDIVHMHAGPVHTYILSHPNLIREVLISKGKCFRKWERQKRVFRKIDGDGLINSEGDFWLRQRRLIQKAFQQRRFGRYAGMMVELTRRRLDRWTAGATIDLDQEMSQLALEITGETLFGVDLRDQAAWLDETAEILRETFIREFLAFVPLPDWLPLPSKRRMRRAIRDLDTFITGIIRARRASGEDKGDLLSMLLLAVDEQGDGTGMTDQQARDEAVTLFNAGHDSTSAALAWTGYYLARYPGVQERLREELAAVLGRRAATWEDLSRLAFAGSVVKEALRIYPPTPVLINREAVTEVEIGGYGLARGSLVILSPYVTQRDPRWFPEPESFDPDRFGPGRVESIPEYAYFPFGAGPHVCVGNTFAMMEITLVVATLVQRFHVELVPGQERLVPELKVSLRPRGGVWVKPAGAAAGRTGRSTCLSFALLRNRLNERETLP
jgi:cytochrome P450